MQTIKNQNIMNKLREKFLKILSCFHKTEQCEQITDDFSVKFAEFIEKYNTHHRIHKRADELLQIFKEKYYK